MIRRTIFGAILILTLPLQAEQLREPVVHHVSRASGEIVIDGVIEESAWADALLLEPNYEVDPGENIEAPVKTEVFLTYDDEAVLVAFRCFVPDTSLIRARYWDRDQLWSDDWVGIVFDTFNDQRRAFEFVVNPFGVQMDAINDDINRRYDASWDAIWESKGRLTADGFEVEVRIPFSQLRFQAVDGPQTWGIDVFRSYPRSDRHHIGLFPRVRGANSYLSQADKVVGFEGVKPGRNLELAPTATWVRTEERPDFPYGPLEEDESNAEAGVTVKWGVTPNIILSAAINPDFSQVEADSVRLDINQQFALFFPETRPFFLEGADYFDTEIDLVHTRTVADPSVALKVTGKEGAHTFGVFTARDELTNLLIPGSEGSDGASFDFESTSTVGRYRYDVGGNSTVGVLFTDRRGSGYSNSVASVDARYRWTDADTLAVNVATSITEYNEEMRSEFGLLTDDIDGFAVELSYDHSVRDWYARASYKDFGSDFRADVGWVPQVDYRLGSIGGGYKWWGEDGDWYNLIQTGGDIDYTVNQAGELLEEEVEGWVLYRGPYLSTAMLGAGTRNRTFEGEEYDQVFQFIRGSLQPTGTVSFGFGINQGDWIDFAHAKPATNISFSPWVDLNLGRHLHLNLNHTSYRLDVEEGELFNTDVSVLRAVYQVNTKLFLRAVVQRVDIERDPELYHDEVEASNTDIFTQFLFSYTINPQSVLYIGYSDQSSQTDDYSLTRANRTFFIKIGYAWLL